MPYLVPTTYGFIHGFIFLCDRGLGIAFSQITIRATNDLPCAAAATTYLPYVPSCGASVTGPCRCVRFYAPSDGGGRRGGGATRRPQPGGPGARQGHTWRVGGHRYVYGKNRYSNFSRVQRID